ncbi:MAG TPA: N-acetyl sugar amidotransferase [Candidatus Magasanikbacteria bacterium]|nr:N-acetyl sugar amidotransferase [Candidatus Magasanikbacteria bacterium]
MSDTNELEAKYGLPREVKFCTRCVMSNQRPNSAVEFKHTAQTKKETIHFNEDGVCDACRVAENKKHTINWEEREKELWELCDRYRKNDGSYDCMVPGSGGKDSFFTAHILKYKYKMHPLTVTWAPHMYTEWGWKNFQAWIHAGFDNFLFTPNGKVHRLLTRLAVENIFHPFQPFMIGQKCFSPKMAVMQKIPLVFWGEQEAEYGNPIADTSSAVQNWKYFTNTDQSQVFLSGVALSELKEKYGFEQVDLEPYLPIDPQLIEENDVKVHYLGYYLKWHPQGNYYYAVENGNFQVAPERTAGSYSKYSSIDDKIDDFHYYTTLIKFGIGRATYDAAQEVRSGDITREEGVSLVRRFDTEYPERFADEVFNYLSITQKDFPVASKVFERPTVDKEYFMHLAEKFRSPHLWEKVNGEWKLRYHVS